MKNLFKQVTPQLVKWLLPRVTARRIALAEEKAHGGKYV